MSRHLAAGGGGAGGAPPGPPLVIQVDELSDEKYCLT